ncbi:MAG: EAL domain-containing protein [Glaciecola sp.]|nr:EAL domain-containing protein [Glaciecola sp.]MDG1816837.1 EAL domain-containing protein [Glaciecola sp.]MDG2099043.1 EAL domain-containing protein [Glaciecola sp.]
MMPKFISIGQKILILILALLFATVSILTVITLKDSNIESEKYQAKSIAANISDYHVIYELITTNATLWAENIIAQFENERMPLQSIEQHLQKQLTYLRLNEQIADVWLFDAEQQLQFSTVGRQDSSYVQPDFTQGFVQNNDYINLIYCQSECVHVLQLPILLADNRYGYMIFTLPITQVLANLYNTTKAEIGIAVNNGEVQANKVSLQPLTLNDKKARLTPIIANIDSQVTLAELNYRGTKIVINQQSYLLTLIPLNPQQLKSEQHYLMMVSEISDFFNAADRFTMGAIITASLLFVGFGAIFYMFTHSYKVRLANLVERFPLINNHQYGQFKQKRLARRSGFKDELDILDEAAEQLADELALLDDALQKDRKALEKIAMYDELTGLANRNMLNEHLRRLIAKFKRCGEGFCVILLDVDDFKKINDGQGHNVGDVLLQIVAASLASQIREEDLVCRFGGDEFVLVLSNVETVESALVVWQKIQTRIAEPVIIDNSQFHITVSAGMTMSDMDEPTVDELIRRSDTAMYRAKEKSGNVLRIYDDELNTEVQRKIDLEREAYKALENGDFYLALQPLIDLKTYFLTGFEALLRWKHPQKGLISPGEFIPVLEKSVFMLKLDYWVIERSFQVLKMLDDEGYKQQTISINLSSAQFLDPVLCEFLQKMFTRYQIRPNRIDLELTETTLVSDIHNTTKIMCDLRNLGVKISIDDFGTGYSSLSYLKSMPVNTIKIDRSFINGILKNQADKQIVLSTITMVHNMGMIVVAEGIEDVRQFNLLRDMRCDKAQGFYIARPISEHELMKTLPLMVLDNVWQASYANKDVS